MEIKLELIGSKKNGHYWYMKSTNIYLNSITYTTKKTAIEALVGNKIKWNILEFKR